MESARNQAGARRRRRSKISWPAGPTGPRAWLVFGAAQLAASIAGIAAAVITTPIWFPVFFIVVLMPLSIVVSCSAL